MRNNKIIGTFHYNKNGGYVLFDIDGESESINVTVGENCVVFDGDTVEIGVFDSFHRNDSSVGGKIIRVVKRRRDYVVGTVARDLTDDTPYITPHGYAPFRIPISETPEHPFEDGDLVKAKLNIGKNAEELSAEPVKVYGDASAYETNLACLTDISPFGSGFSQEAVIQTRELIRIGNPADMSGRRTYNAGIFSPIARGGQYADTAYGIDCGDSSTIIYIHISDVDSFLKEDTPLASDAFRRFCSVFDSSSSKYALFPMALANSLFNLIAPGEHPAITLTLEATTDAVRLINVEESVVSNVTPLTMQDVKFALGVFLVGSTTFASELRRAYIIANDLRERRRRAGGLTVGKTNIATFSESSKTTSPVDYDRAPFIFDELLYAAGEALAHNYVMEGARGLYAGGKYPVVYDTTEPPLYCRPFLAFADIYSKDFINTAASEAKKSAKEGEVVPYINFMLDGFAYSENPVPNELLGLKMYAPVAHPTERFDAVIQQRAIRAMMYGKPFGFGGSAACTERAAAARDVDRALRLMSGIRHLSGKSGIPVTVISDKEPFIVKTEGGILGELVCSTPMLIERIKDGARLQVRTKEVSYAKREIRFSF